MSRLTTIKNLLKERNIDAIYITSPENHRYLCGFHNPDGQLLITKNKSYVFADFRYIEAANRECDPAFEVIMPDGTKDTALRRFVFENGVKVLGVEEDNLTLAAYNEIKEALEGCEIVGAADIPAQMRIIKEDKEIECIVKAQRIAERAFDRLLRSMTPDMTETEAAAELEYLMKKEGAEGISFETIAVSGGNSSSPHGVPRNVKIEKGFMTFDFGALINGYHSDMTRTVVIGKADEEMKRLYNTVLKAQRDVLDVITEGASNFEMDKIARDVIEGAGYHGRFGHSLGHGVGLLIHEKPNLAPKSHKDMVLRAGEVVTVEPGIYIEGLYGCRIEDMVAITKGGAVNLTECPKELIELF